MISDGYYSKGKKLNVELCEEMGKGYWKEYDENGKLIRVCQKDGFGDYDGISYLYNSGQISRVSLWKKGKETKVLKQFSGESMTEYKNGERVYEGGFLDSLELGYPRNGEGEEIGKGGKKRIFKGHYKNGLRHGVGTKYKGGIAKGKQQWVLGYTACGILGIYASIAAVIIFVCILGHVIHPIVSISLLVICLLLILIRWICNHCIRKGKCCNLNLNDAASIFIDDYMSKKDRNTCVSKILGIRNTKISYISLVLIFLGILLIVICICYFVGNSFFTPFIGLFQKSFVVKSNGYNKLATLDLSNKPFLQKIEIGNDCFGSVKTFRIHGLNRLRTITIGNNSFTQSKNLYGDDESKSFHILNCESLESIQIGEYSFSDFGGEFELKNLPQLQSIQIGTIGSYSNNFYGSSFVIRGIEMILNI